MFLSRKQMNESLFAQEWRQEGALMTRRDSILRVLRSRLKLTQTEELATALELIKGLDRLDHLLDVAATCATIDEFRAAL